jgi:hypothetical protein
VLVVVAVAVDVEAMLVPPAPDEAAAASACAGVSVPGAAPITALAGAYGIASLFFKQ